MPIDYSKYPDNWKSEIVPAIRDRSGDKCEWCGLENGQTVWSVPFLIREISKYKRRMIWFRSKSDAIRECRDHRDVKEVQVVLTVAHLDHDEENENVPIDRLAHLCQACHLRYDAKEKYRRICQKWESK